MIMNILRDLLDRFGLFRIFFILLSLIITMFVFFSIIFSQNDYAVFFYPELKNSQIGYEVREIKKGDKYEKYLMNFISEFLLGPVSHEFTDFFPAESKVLSLYVDNRLLHLNLSKETLNDSKFFKNALMSLVNSVILNNHKISSIRLYFNGKYYRYIGNSIDQENGLLFNRDFLK